MPRKPVHLERAGGKGPRQRIWEAIRARSLKAQPILAKVLVKALEIDPRTCNGYLAALQAGGYLAPAADGGLTLVKDAGIDAPRLRADGQPVTSGRGNECLWATLPILRDFNYRELAHFASTPETPIKWSAAQSYVQTLHAAGYLVQTAPAVIGKRARPARYRLKPGKFTGPRPPMIQRTKSLYDPNLNAVVWQEHIDIEEASDAC